MWLPLWKVFAVCTISVLLTIIGLVFFTFPTEARGRLELLLLQFWCRALCRVFSLKIRLSGEPIPRGDGNYLVTPNHVSYFDIIAVGSLLPTSYLAKSSIRFWPIFGIGAIVAGILFVDRESRDSRKGVRGRAIAHLKKRLSLCLFPEGTTGEGIDLLPFRWGAFKVATDADVPVLPITICYDDPERLKWVGNTTFLGHFLKLSRETKIGMRIDVGKPVDPKLFANAHDFANSVRHDMQRTLRRLYHVQRVGIEGIDWNEFLLRKDDSEVEIHAFIEKTLRRLIAIDSSDVFGERQVCRVVTEILRANRIECKNHKSPRGHPNLHSVIGNPQEPGIVLLANSDVVPAVEEDWSISPFEAIELDGTIYGRGALDMKSQLATLLALHILAAKHGQSRTPLHLLVLADEEKGGEEGSQFFCSKLLKEINCKALLGEGGFGIDHYEGIEGPLFLISTAEKGSFWVKLSVHAETMAHSSTPPDEYASTILLDALQRVRKMPLGFELCPASEQFIQAAGQKSPTFASIMPHIYRIPVVGPKVLAPIEKDPYLRAMFHTTVALTQFRGGSVPNVIPSDVEAVLDFRLHVNQNADDLLGKIKETIGDKRVQISVIHQSPPNRSSFDSEEFERLKNAVLEEYPDAVVCPFLLPASTDISFFRQAGVENCFGLFPAALSWDQIQSIHGKDERVTREQLLRAFRVYRNFLSQEGVLP